MSALALKQQFATSPFYINSTFEGKKGRLYATDQDYLFTVNNEVLHAIPLETIRSIALNSKNSLQISKDNKTYNYSIEDNRESVNEVYYFLKGQTLSPKKVDSFFKNNVDLLELECKKMFPNSLVAWLMETPNLLHNNEKIQAALPGRFCPSFSKHTNGILMVTNQRIFFSSNGEVLKTLERSQYKNLRIINCFDNFSDEFGRKSYSVEFNESDFVVSVKTSRHIKIEMFHKVLEPNKELDENF